MLLVGIKKWVLWGTSPNYYINLLCRQTVNFPLFSLSVQSTSNSVGYLIELSLIFASVFN